MPRISDCDVRKFAGMIGTQFTPPLDMFCEHLSPRLLIGQGAGFFLSVRTFNYGRRHAGPTIAAIAQAAQSFRIINSHPPEHLQRAIGRWRSRTEERYRQAQLSIEFGATLAGFLHSGNITWFSDKNRWPGRVLNLL
jgi:hypothetical protein